MALVTFITPIGPYHLAYAARIQAIVRAQTVACCHLIVYDTDGRGPGWARNQALQAVETPFVVFLDADDAVAPMYAERTLAAYEKHQKYIYTDWWANGQRRSAPHCPWAPGTQNTITALVPTDWARAVGGFDELLPGAEDSDFFVKLRAAGLCGRRLPEALFTYGGAGQRSQALISSPQHKTTMDLLRQRYGGVMSDCGGCGAGNVDLPTVPLNEETPGTVLATALWSGNRRERGRITGVIYPRAGNGDRMYVYPEDIAAAPELFARADAYADAPPADLETPAPLSLEQIARMLASTEGQTGMGKPVMALPSMDSAPPAAAPAPTPERAKRVAALARKRA